MNILWFDELASTNQYLAENYKTLENHTVVVAKEQVNGRGLGANTWHSTKDESITLSYLFRPDQVLAADQFQLNIATSLAVSDFLSETSAQHFDIKWPNDILHDNRKITGILIQHIILGDKILASILGIGININQTHFPADIPNPVSLQQITGKKNEISELVESLSLRLKKYLVKGTEKINTTMFRERYLDLLYRNGIWKNYIIRDKRLTAMITGISKEGLLQMIDTDSNSYQCDLKEVKYLY